MAASELKFTKTWTSSADFPTYEPDEAQVRADMQLLFDEIKNHINTVLLPDLLKRVPDTRMVNGHALDDDVAVTKGDVGLGNADNTSDVDKPVSTAQQAALDLKSDKTNVLEKDNSTDYTPTQNYHPATKKYVDETLSGAVLGQLPDNSIEEEKLSPDLRTYIAQQMPAGGIIMWSGSESNIPSGWALCNGQNGTPDLRDRFIIGAGSTHRAGTTGGNASVQLSENNLPAHSHTFSNGKAASAGSHTHSDTFSVSSGGSHSHTVNTVSTDTSYMIVTQANNSSSERLYGVGDNRFEEVETDTESAHTHSLTGSVSSGGAHTHTVTGTIGSTGSGNAFSILPPYYALCFIMKL